MGKFLGLIVLGVGAYAIFGWRGLEIVGPGCTYFEQWSGKCASR